jgi:mono/diheme cytochrome c family protein
MPDLRLTDQEAADLAAYLASLRDEAWEQEVPPPPSEDIVRDLALEALRATWKAGERTPEEAVGAASREERLRIVGERAITRYSCFGCHDIRGRENAERIGTELGGGESWGSKDVDRLDFGLLEDPKAVETYADWGTGILPERPGGGRALPHRKPEWAWLKLKNPRIYDAGLTKRPHEKLVMPNFHFTDDEADAVVAFLLSLRRGEVPATKRRLRDSREIVAEKMLWAARQYNCFGCHTLRTGAEERWMPSWRKRLLLPVGRGGDIRPWLEDDRVQWPPSLGGEGTKAVGEGFRVQAPFLYGFLRDPGKRVLRPWLKVRMPTFNFQQQELNAVVQGFAAQDAVPFPFEVQPSGVLTEEERKEARDLFVAIECFACHPSEGDAEAGRKQTGLAPDLTGARSRLRYEWVLNWFHDPGAMIKGTSMPSIWGNGPAPRKGKVLDGRAFFGGDPSVQMRKLADFVFGLEAPERPSGGD